MLECAEERGGRFWETRNPKREWGVYSNSGGLGRELWRLVGIATKAVENVSGALLDRFSWEEDFHREEEGGSFWLGKQAEGERQKAESRK